MSHKQRARLTLAAMGVAITLVGARAYAQTNGKPGDSLPNPYRVVENYFKLPEGRTLGSTPAIDIDRDGRSIWVFERCGKGSGGAPCVDTHVAPILKFDAAGSLVKSFGDGMFVNPHGIHVDAEGNVWVTDGGGKDAKGQQVFKLSPDGRVLMTLGKAGVAGDGPDTFNQPSDVLVAPSGVVFVADGHGGNSNARIVKFSKDGKFITAWGRRARAPANWTRHTGSPWTRAAGSSSPIGEQPDSDLRPGGQVSRRVETIRTAERNLHRQERHAVRGR